jgi:hypothetical protein
MTVLSTLTDTILLTAMDDGDKKKKLTIAAVTLVGLILMLHWRSGDSEEDEESEEGEENEDSEEQMESETESEDEESETEEIEGISESAEEELAEVRRELDVFDMLAILAAAIKAAREEYDQRAET